MPSLGLGDSIDTVSGREELAKKVADSTRTIMAYSGGILQPVTVPRPKEPPRHCGSSNEDLECLGCGCKIGCLEPGHCYAVEGRAAYRK